MLESYISEKVYVCPPVIATSLKNHFASQLVYQDTTIFAALLLLYQGAGYTNLDIFFHQLPLYQSVGNQAVQDSKLEFNIILVPDADTKLIFHKNNIHIKNNIKYKNIFFILIKVKNCIIIKHFSLKI
ncbi:MAG: hypothetical protein Q8S84_09410 [bacterium]|nr:hypothetical protein [bacterium]